MNRRSFLHLAAVTSLGLITASCRRGVADDDRALARPALLDALGAERVRALGERYRATHAGERDAGALREAIRRSPGLGARFLASTPARVPDLVRDDFEHGRTVVVDGWILAATEARQCALFSLRG